MKIKPLLIAFALATLAVEASAATDRSYYVTELVSAQKFDVFNDGRNTYLESIPGLVVTGATADGEFYIVKGVPSQIKGYFNGKSITVLRGLPPPAAPAKPDASALSAQIKRLSDELQVLTTTAAVTVDKPKLPHNALERTADSGLATAGKQLSPAAPPANAAAPLTKVWEVRASDITLYGTMKRWSKDAGMQLIWETENHDLRLRGLASYAVDFDVAVVELMKSVQFSDYPMRACIYENGSLRVVHTKKSCKG